MGAGHAGEGGGGVGSKAAGPLDAAACSAVEEILGSAVVSAEVVWERTHVVRVGLADGSSAVVKRPRSQRGGEQSNPQEAREAFDAELLELQHLQGAPDGVVPRLLGACADPPLLVMEALPEGRSVAESLLSADRGRALADLEGLAAALGSVHRWSFDHPGPDRPWGVERLARSGVNELADAALTLGVAAPEAFGEEASAMVEEALSGGVWRGFVHNDACPDNTLITDDRFVLFDFETSGTASVLLDAAYLVAPFPTCWCWAPLPAEVVERVLAVYRKALGDRGSDPGFDGALATALGAWFVGWASAITRSLGADREWGTTGGRVRLVRWGHAFVERSAAADVWAEVRAVVEEVVAELEARWGSALPTYPAFAEPGDPDASVVSAPAWFTHP